MYQRIIITILLTMAYFLLPKYGFTSYDSGLTGHLLYPISHANIFHLLGNVLCLWMLRCPLHIGICYAIAVLCGFLPCLTSEPTMGFSGILFAMAGISWGRTGKFGMMCRKCLPYILICLLIPHVNVMIHVYCLMAGYLYGTLKIEDPIAKYDGYNGISGFSGRKGGRK